jgi:hypothetical protein
MHHGGLVLGTEDHDLVGENSLRNNLLFDIFFPLNLFPAPASHF